MLQCLQRALKVARTCSEKAAEVALYVEILNYYVYYFEKSCDQVRRRWRAHTYSHTLTHSRTHAHAQVSISHIKKIAELVQSSVKEVEGDEAEQIKAHFRATLAHIDYKKGMSQHTSPSHTPHPRHPHHTHTHTHTCTLNSSKPGQRSQLRRVPALMNVLCGGKHMRLSHVSLAHTHTHTHTHMHHACEWEGRR